MAKSKTDTPAAQPPAGEFPPQGGSYTRNPDGSLVRQAFTLDAPPASPHAHVNPQEVSSDADQEESPAG